MEIKRFLARVDAFHGSSVRLEDNTDTPPRTSDGQRSPQLEDDTGTIDLKLESGQYLQKLEETLHIQRAPVKEVYDMYMCPCNPKISDLFATLV